MRYLKNILRFQKDLVRNVEEKNEKLLIENVNYHRTSIENLGEVVLPDPNTGDFKLSVMPFENTGEWVSLPHGFKLWEESFNEVLKYIPLQEGANTHYVTIDTKFFTTDEFLRREGVHIDGNFCVDPYFSSSIIQENSSSGGDSPKRSREEIRKLIRQKAQDAKRRQLLNSNPDNSSPKDLKKNLATIFRTSWGGASPNLDKSSWGGASPNLDKSSWGGASPDLDKSSWGGASPNLDKSSWGGASPDLDKSSGGGASPDLGRSSWGGASYESVSILPRYSLVKDENNIYSLIRESNFVAHPDNSHVKMDWVLPYDLVIPISEYVSSTKGGILTVSSEVGCQAWDGDFYGEIMSEGSFEKMEDQLSDDRKVIFEKNKLYFMSSNTPHETLLINKGKRRTFLRITLNHNYQNQVFTKR